MLMVNFTAELWTDAERSKVQLRRQILICILAIATNQKAIRENEKALVISMLSSIMLSKLTLCRLVH
ncbi:hypothetical protein HPP92_009292 [Vanilla planifolia]|uniref:Uncharacterized protein n=1 Tax=Vanilla planifolia TaxID=51239 RepID=A0A835RJM1_VANPL|nr:hypothetical protein HPP92_009292 [Vanilla planifolia]